MPQRRRRTYIVGYQNASAVERKIGRLDRWILHDGVMTKAFPFTSKGKLSEFKIEGSIPEVSENFNKDKKTSPFADAGIIKDRKVMTISTSPVY